jgi:SAM-dependent methyltransferase
MAAPCRICASHRTQERTLVRRGDGKQLPIVVCDECGYGHRNEQRSFTDHLHLQEAYFDAQAAPPPGVPKWPQRSALLAARVNRMFPRPGRLLDIGCGPGEWMASLGALGWELHGIEVAPVVAEIARKFTGGQVFCGPFEKYQAPVDGFDLIAALALIEHLLEPRELVEWAYQHLRPGGVFMVMTGDRASRHGREAGDQWPYYWIEEHFSYFSGESLRRLYQQAGFVEIRLEWLYSGLQRPREPLTAYAARMREVLGWVRRPTYNHVYVYGRKR